MAQMFKATAISGTEARLRVSLLARRNSAMRRGSMAKQTKKNLKSLHMHMNPNITMRKNMFNQSLASSQATDSFIGYDETDIYDISVKSSLISRATYIGNEQDPENKEEQKSQSKSKFDQTEFDNQNKGETGNKKEGGMNLIQLQRANEIEEFKEEMSREMNEESDRDNHLLFDIPQHYEEQKNPDQQVFTEYHEFDSFMQK